MKRNVVFFIVMTLLLVNVFGVVASADTTYTITKVVEATMDVDFSESDQGIVKVLYNTGLDKKVKLLIQQDETKYYYNLSSNETYVNFPLQFGDGTYTVKIYENTSGNSYKRAYAITQYVDILDENAVYLTSTQEVPWDVEDTAVELAESLVEEAIVAKNPTLFKGLVLNVDETLMTAEEIEAFNLTRDSYFENEAIVPLTEAEVIDVLYTYVISNISYDYDKISTLEYDYIPDADLVLEEQSGICYDYSVLLAVMLRSQNIPTKLVKGYAEFTDVYHAWNEIYLSEEDRWVVVDTTYDAYFLQSEKQFDMAKAVEDYHGSKSF